MLIELLTEKYPGMRFWLTQRITALFMAIYIPLLILNICIQQPKDYASWVAFNSPWWWQLLTCLFFLSICIHAWIGIKDVFRDYVYNQQLRGYLQFLVELALSAYLIWFTFIIWRL